jgi:hypothetical protein
VPYVGAVTTVDLGAQGLRAGYVRFNTSVVSVPNEQGLMYWDGDDETIAVILNGYIMKIGEDQFYPVKNQTGSSIAKGTAVRFAGTVGASGRLLIAPFIADGSVSSSFFMGVTAEAIADGADGKVLYFGRIRGINTNAFNEGDVLYASTTVAGGFQTAVPLAPNNIVQVAAVITKSINQGVIFIRPSFGSNINQDEGVKIVSPTTGQLLQLQANGLWENKTTAQVLGGTSSQFVKGDGTLDSNTYQVTSEKGQPNGYASLDGNGKVPLVQINDALIGNVNFQGLWNASTNTPTLANPPASGTKGYYYIVDTAGTFASISFEVGDWIISDGTAWGKVDNTDAVSSVFGRTGNVTAANGDYNTSQVTENTNLYYTEARVNANTNVAANTVARHTAVTLGTANGLSLSTQQLSLGLASAGVTGALSGTDWSTFNSKQNALTNPVTGTGTTNYLPKFTGASTIGNSAIFENAGNVAIGTTSPSDYNDGFGNKLVLANTSGSTGLTIVTSTSGNGNIYFADGTTGDQQFRGIIAYEHANDAMRFSTQATERMRITSGGRVLIGTPPPAESTFALDVNGTGRFSEKITSSVGNNAQILTTQGATTGYQFLDIVNTSGRLVIAQEGMTAGTVFIGTTAYASAIGTAVSRDFQIGTNNTIRLTIAAATGAASFSNVVTAQGRIISGAGAFRNGGFYIPSSTANTGSRTWAMTNDEIEWGDFSIITSSTQTGDINTTRLYINSLGAATINNLSGSGNRIVVANSGGTLISAVIGSGLAFDGTTLTATGGASGSISGSGTSGTIAVFTGAASIGNSVITQSGSNIGIGTGSPATQLSILSSTASSSTLDAIFNITNDIDSNIRVFVTGSNSTDKRAGIGPTTNTALCLITNSAERMRITSDGNVLIGTTTDAGFKLDVNGTGRFSNTLRVSPTTSPIIQLYRNANLGTNESAGILSFGGLNTSVFTEGAYIGAFAAGNYSTTQVPTYLTFGTTPSESTAPIERLRIHQNGNIVFKGQSTTTSAESLFQNTNSALNFYATDSISFSKNIGFFTNTTTAQERMRINSNGTIAFNGNSTPDNGGFDKMSLGFSNSAYGWIQTWGGRPLTLNSQGNNVLIGTTTDSGDRLRVNGNTYTNTIRTLKPDSDNRSVEWKFGEASTLSITANKRIRVSVDGVQYWLAAAEI